MNIIGPIGYNKGLNTKAFTNTIGKDQMSDAQNIRIVENDLVKFTGARYLNSSAIATTPAITGLTDWQSSAGQRSQVIIAGTNAYYTNDLSTTFTSITGSVTITSGVKSTFASLNGKLVRCGGTDAPIVWTGSGNFSALAGSPPSGNICCTVNNFMFITGSSANPSRVNWCNVIDPTTWSATSYVDFRKDDGDKVTALIGQDQNLIIFKRNAIGKLDTTSNVVSGFATLGPLYTSIPGIGCAGPLALDNLPDGRIVFVSTNFHVYLYDGVTAIDISDSALPLSNVQTILDGCVLPQNCVVRYYPTQQEIWFSVTTSGNSNNNLILVYDYNKKVWISKLPTKNANVMCTAIDTRAQINHTTVLLTGNYAGRVFEQDYGTNDIEATNSVIDAYGTVTLQLSADGSEVIPRSALIPLQYEGAWTVEFNYGYNDFDVVSKSNTLALNVTSAGVLDTFVLDTDTLGGSGPIRAKTTLVSSNKNSSIQVQLRNRYADQPFIIHPFYLSDEVFI